MRLAGSLSFLFHPVSALPPDSVTLQASSRDSAGPGQGSGRGKGVSSEAELAHILC